MSLIKDPAYLAITKKFAADRESLTTEFGKAWYKLMTRDMGPHTRCLGKLTAPPQVRPLSWMAARCSLCCAAIAGFIAGSLCMHARAAPVKSRS